MRYSTDRRRHVRRHVPDIDVNVSPFEVPLELLDLRPLTAGRAERVKDVREEAPWEDAYSRPRRSSGLITRSATETHSAVTFGAVSCQRTSSRARSRARIGRDAGP